MDWIQNNRTLLIIEGVLFTLLGIVAVALPGVSTLSIELFIGWLLVFAGVFQLYRTVKAGRQSSGFFALLATSILYVIFGILLVLFPVAGIFSLTILLTLFFIAEGIAKIALGIQLRPTRLWGWFILNGVLALGMAFIIWAGWPGTAYWVLGLLVGINMIFFGISLIFLGMGTPRIDASA